MENNQFTIVLPRSRRVKNLIRPIDPFKNGFFSKLQYIHSNMIVRSVQTDDRGRTMELIERCLIWFWFQGIRVLAPEIIIL